MRKSFMAVLTAAIFLANMPVNAAFEPIVGITPAIVVNTASPLYQASDSPWDDTALLHDTLASYWRTPGLLDLGFRFSSEHANLVLRLDLRQDYSAYLKEKTWTNIPFIGNSLNGILDMNFPRVGYVDVTLPGLYASIGRRQLKWGPATYDLAISDSQPFLDSIWIDYHTPDGKHDGSWWYNFVAVGFGNAGFQYNSTEERNKNLFAHRFGFENQWLRVALGELNMVYNTVPSILDFTPVGIWHNLYQDEHSNVMLHLSVEALAGPVRMYGVFAMDDLDLPSEPKNNGKPAAMGFTAGVEWHVLSGTPISRKEFSYQDYKLSENTFAAEDGLRVGAEFYYATNYLYNRNKQLNGTNGGDSSMGRFTVPGRIYTFGYGHITNPDMYFLGFPYGPGVMLTSLSGTWTDDPWEVTTRLDWIRNGQDDILTDITTDISQKESWFFLVGPLTDTLRISASAAWHRTASSKIFAATTLTVPVTEDEAPTMELSVGASFLFGN